MSIQSYGKSILNKDEPTENRFIGDRSKPQGLFHLIGPELNGVLSFATFRRTLLEIDLEQLSDLFHTP